MEFVRCPHKFLICGVAFKCDLQMGHSGFCVSLPDGDKKLAMVVFPAVNQSGMMEFVINPDKIKENLKNMVLGRNDDVHDRWSWWNGAVNGYLEALGLGWDMVEKIEAGCDF